MPNTLLADYALEKSLLAEQAGGGLVLLVKSVKPRRGHDVSGEARDDDGKWTDSGRAPAKSYPITDEFKATPAQIARGKELGVSVGANSWHVEFPEGGKYIVKLRDAKGRSQSKRRTEATQAADARKFAALEKVAKSLPKIKRAIKTDLIAPDATKERSVAAATTLIIRGCLRVGGERHFKATGSMGASSLRKRNVKVEGDKVILDFPGKEGVRWHREIKNHDLAAAVAHLLTLPGDRLFQFHDSSGDIHPVTDNTVRNYLDPFGVNPSQFRTYHANKIVAHDLDTAPNPSSAREAQRRVNASLDKACAFLNNTRAIAKSSYVNPAIIRRYLSWLGKSIENEGDGEEWSDERFAQYLKELGELIRSGAISEDDPEDHELFSRKGGMKWWKENGIAGSGVFDLSPDSISMKILNARLQSMSMPPITSAAKKKQSSKKPGRRLQKSVVLLVSNVAPPSPFAAFLTKAVDTDHIEQRRAEVAKCRHGEDKTCYIAGLGGFKHPAVYCPKCGRLRMKDKRLHGFASGKSPMLKAVCASDWKPGQIEKAIPSGCFRDPKSCQLRWITAHSHGGDSDGVPLLVHDNGEEYTVVGGAGGRMNQQVFQKPASQRTEGKDSIRLAKKEEKKRQAIETLGEKGEQMRENAKALQAKAKEQEAPFLDKLLGLVHGSMSAEGAMAGVESEARKRAVKENPNASEEEQNEFADVAAKSAVGEAKNVAKQALNSILDRAAMRALGDDDGSPVQFEANVNGKKLIRDLSPEQIDDIIHEAASIAAIKGQARAIQRAIAAGQPEVLEGIDADVKPLSMDEAKQKNLDRYLNEQDVDNQTALVIATNAAPDITRKRNQANGAMDGLNSLSASLTGKAILRPELVKTLGVEDSARVAAAYLTAQGVDTGATAEGLRERIGSQSAASVAAAIGKVREMDAIVDHAKAAAAEGDGSVTTAQSSILAANMAQIKYKFLNVTRGQLRAGAALAHHLENPSDRPLSLTGGSTATAAHAMAKGLGLKDGDYQVEKAERGSGGGYKITVPADNIAGLASPHGMAESDRNLAMDQLRQDVEDNPGAWHPQGLNNDIRLAPHQELAARALVQNKHMIWNLSAGSGKTSCAYAAMADLLSSGKVDKCLMSMPAKVKAQQQEYEEPDEKSGEMVKKPGEADKFLSPELRKQTMVADSANWKKTIAAVKDGTCKIMVCSPDMLRIHQKELQDLGFGGEKSCFVADEAHRFAIGQSEGEGSGMAKAAAQFAKSEFASYMSGTLIENSSDELHSALDSLFPGQFGSQKSFTQEWQRLAQGGGDLFSSEAMKGMRDRLSGSMVSYSKPVSGPSGKPLTLTKNTVVVKATPAQKAAIAKLNVQYKKERANPDPAISKAAALRRDQRANAILTTGVKLADGSIENPKLEALKQIMDHEKGRDPKNRIGVYSRELAPLRSAKDALKGRNMTRITGSEDDKATRAALSLVKDRKNNTDGVLFTDAAATGTNMQSLDHIVFMHPFDVPSKRDQAEHRHFRQGATTDKFATMLRTDMLQEENRSYREEHVKKPEMDLLTALSDDHGLAGTLARHLPALEEMAGEKYDAAV